MILIAGAGASAEAARAIRENQRDLKRRIGETKRRAASRIAHYEDYEPERVEFDCEYLCGTCGYFTDNPNIPGDSEERTVRPCPACGAEEWLDLAVEPVVGRIRELEESERMQVPARIRAAVIAGALGFFVLLFGGVVGGSYLATGDWFAPAYAPYAGAVAALALFVVPLVSYFAPRPAAVLLLRGRERIPNRWHLPTELPATGESPNDTRIGTARSEEERLRAPFSRRECLCYQVCVLFDTGGDARPPEWVLHEQRAVPIQIGESGQLAPDALFLESPVQRVRVPGDPSGTDVAPPEENSPDLSYEDVKRFLRKRGLSITDGTFHFYEARVEPGDEVTVEVYDEISILRDATSGSVPAGARLPHPVSVADERGEVPFDYDESKLSEVQERSRAERLAAQYGRVAVGSAAMGLVCLGALYWVVQLGFFSPLQGNFLHMFATFWILVPALVVGLVLAVTWVVRSLRLRAYFRGQRGEQNASDA